MTADPTLATLRERLAAWTHGDEYGAALVSSDWYALADAILAADPIRQALDAALGERDAALTALAVMDEKVMALGRLMVRPSGANATLELAAIGTAIGDTVNTHAAAKPLLAAHRARTALEAEG